MSKSDTIMTLQNLKKDILARKVPLSCDGETVRCVRTVVLDEINKTIKRKT